MLTEFVFVLLVGGAMGLVAGRSSFARPTERPASAPTWVHPELEATRRELDTLRRQAREMKAVLEFIRRDLRASIGNGGVVGDGPVDELVVARYAEAIRSQAFERGRRSILEPVLEDAQGIEACLRVSDGDSALRLAAGIAKFLCEQQESRGVQERCC